MREAKFPEERVVPRLLRISVLALRLNFSLALGQRYGVTVIGVQLGEERILNPLPDFLLDAGDVPPDCGLPEKIEAFAATCSQKPLPKNA